MDGAAGRGAGENSTGDARLPPKRREAARARHRRGASGDGGPFETEGARATEATTMPVRQLWQRPIVVVLAGLALVVVGGVARSDAHTGDGAPGRPLRCEHVVRRAFSRRVG